MAKATDEQEIHLKDLTPDPANAREHTARNVGTIVDALHEVGAARSIVVDEDNVILAGNATVEAAAEAGLYKVRVIEANGEEIIAVRRRGLTPEQKARLALYDNRAGELSKWNEPALQALAERGLTRGLFSPEELTVLIQGITADRPDDAPPAAFPIVDETIPTSFQCPRCRYEWSGAPRPADATATAQAGAQEMARMKGGVYDDDPGIDTHKDDDLAGDEEQQPA